MKALRGTLIECDEAVLVIIKDLNEKHDGQIIIETLDERFVFVKNDKVALVVREVENFLEQQTYRTAAGGADD
ncbi:hypothetical protein HK098_005398 [Nowakowskiella sp. JEL0407]|nr:hypothetical protein HK098_005398 [Nowakowskiella sp. JEL0407]